MLITHLGMGGAEKVFNDHARAFTAFGDVTECVYSRDHLDPAMITGNPMLELDEQMPSGSLKRFLYRRKRLSSIVAKQNPAVCISHMEGPNILNSITNTGKCKKILCVHGSIMRDSAKSKWKKWMLNRLVIPFTYSRANAIVTVSQKMRQEILSLGLNPAKVHAIPNFFDIDRIVTLSQEDLGEYKQLFAEKKVLLHVGRLSRQKNQRVLLQVMAAYKKTDPEVKLCIAGDGELKAALLEYAATLNLSVYDAAQTNELHTGYDVYFLGKQANPYRFMGAAKLFLLSSFFEGFPLVLGEAMACGLPIVSVNCETGPEELLIMNTPPATTATEQPFYADCGVLMPDWYSDTLTQPQVQMWTAAIEKVLRDKTLYTNLKENCHIKVQQYNKDRVINYWKDLIEAVIHDK